MPAIAPELRLLPTTVRSWRIRFNRQGVAGLQEQPRPGRPPSDTPEQVSEVIATSLTNPQELGLPCAGWTLDRLAAYLHEVQGLPLKKAYTGEALCRPA